MRKFICDNITENASGHLCFAGQDTVALASQYGTPLYLMDEERIRHNCRVYVDAMKKHFGDKAMPLFASKANSFTQIYRIVKDEDMGIDVVSAGEIHSAVRAGFDMKKAYFHGCCIMDAEIGYAMDNGVGTIVVNNMEELEAVDRIAEEKGILQEILLRLTPGIDPHTYAAVNTGTVDSKFGFPIQTGSAEDAFAVAAQMKHVLLTGIHCHIGSEVFTEDVFERAAKVMIDFLVLMRSRFGCALPKLNLGGGYGVRYVDTDPYIDIAEKIGQVAEVIKKICQEKKMEVPMILMEPGRSIVADAGMTLYSAAGVKRIKDVKNYCLIDGGMADNPRYALYGARYTCFNASRMNETSDGVFDIGGRCCESGDMIQQKVPMPETTCKGDIIAVCTTGAYNFSMSSNYNRTLRPPIVMLNKGESYVAVKRETLERLTDLDV